MDNEETSNAASKKMNEVRKCMTVKMKLKADVIHR